jgi:hypothetical protein
MKIFAFFSEFAITDKEEFAWAEFAVHTEF